MKNVTAIKAILSGEETNSIVTQAVEEDTVAIGDIHIESSSIKVRLENYKTFTLPQRPRLPAQGNVLANVCGTCGRTNVLGFYI